MSEELVAYSVVGSAQQHFRWFKGNPKPSSQKKTLNTHLSVIFISCYGHILRGAHGPEISPSQRFADSLSMP